MPRCTRKDSWERVWAFRMRRQDRIIAPNQDSRIISAAEHAKGTEWRNQTASRGSRRPTRPFPANGPAARIDQERSMRAPPLAMDEGKQIGVDHVSMGERHAVRLALVDLQRGIPASLADSK